MSLQETAAEGESLWQRDEMSCDGMRGCCEGYVITQVGLSGLYSRRRPCIRMMSYVLLKCQAGLRGRRPAATAHGRVRFGRSTVQRSRSLTETLQNKSVVCVFCFFFCFSAAACGGFQTHFTAFIFIYFYQNRTKHSACTIYHL